MHVAGVRWCPGPELNRYVSFETRDFKSRASTSFATRAGGKSFEVDISVHRRKLSERCRVRWLRSIWRLRSSLLLASASP
jgi:hypothetical protein